MSEDLKTKLDIKSLDELHVIAKKLRVPNAGDLDKAGMVEAIMQLDDKKVRAQLNPTSLKTRSRVAIGLAAMLGVLLCVNLYFHPVTLNGPPPLKASDFQMQLAVTDQTLTEKDIEKFPKVIPCKTKVGDLSLEFDLNRLDALQYARTQGTPVPMLPYYAENIRMLNGQKQALDDLYGSKFQLRLPTKFKDITGPSTVCNATVTFGKEAFTARWQQAGDGILTVGIDRPTH